MSERLKIYNGIRSKRKLLNQYNKLNPYALRPFK